jgi:pimeloyl-ACP methyl ester carboxylesterase
VNGVWSSWSVDLTSASAASWRAAQPAVSAAGSARRPRRVGATTTPIQIVAGRNDDLVPWSNNQYLDDLLPNSEIHPLDAGHFAWEQAAEEYGGLVADWVSDGYRRVAAD